MKLSEVYSVQNGPIQLAESKMAAIIKFEKNEFESDWIISWVRVRMSESVFAVNLREDNKVSEWVKMCSG